MTVVLGIAFAIAILLVSKHTHTQEIVLLRCGVNISADSLDVQMFDASLQIFGMVFAMILYCQIGRKEGATSPGNA